MALGTNHTTTTTNDVFIPEMWSDEVVAGYKANHVMPNLVQIMNHNGGKGDVIHIPSPTRGSASAKGAETEVTLIANTETKIDISIDKHYHYARAIEDLLSVQAIESYRRFYTDDAGYALATQVDTDLHALGAALQGGTSYSGAVIGGDGTTAWDGSANTNTGNGSTLTDAGIRRMMQTLDEDNVPMNGRHMVVPPVEKNTLLGIDRFVLWNNVGEAGSRNSIRNGFIGDVYGMDVYVSTNCATVTADDATTDYYAGLMFHKDAFVLVEQMAPRTQYQYKLEWLTDLFVADMVYGVGEIRDNAGIAFIVPQ